MTQHTNAQQIPAGVLCAQGKLALTGELGTIVRLTVYQHTRM